MAVKKKTALAAGLTVAGLATAGVVPFGGNAFAEHTPSPTTPSSSSTTAKGPQDGQRGGQDGQRGGSRDTPVTGDEAQKVIDAVQAKNAGTKITEVRKDPDGSYDAVGTKSDGTRVMYDVSKDLKTITEATRPAR